MNFETSEKYTEYINNMHLDNWKTIEPTKYAKSDKFYLYPDYVVFEKEYSETLDTSKFSYEFLNNFVMDAIFAQNNKKPVELLTSNEKLGICIGSGIPIKYENGKFMTTYNVGFALIDCKYKAFYNIDPFNTYC